MTDTKKDKLRKLLALADGTANEAEAMAALQKAQDYAATYGLSLDDIRNSTEESRDFVTTDPLYSGRSGNAKKWRNWTICDWHLWKPLSEFCGVKVRVAVDADGDNALQYFGHSADVDLVIYLRKNINKAFNMEWEVYRDFVLDERVRLSTAKLDTAMYSFTLGMADRLRERMTALRKEQTAIPAGNELIVLKGALVEKKANEVGFQEHRGSAGAARSVDGAAWAAGRDSGDRVAFGRGVSGNGVKMIGR